MIRQSAPSRPPAWKRPVATGPSATAPQTNRTSLSAGLAQDLVLPVGHAAAGGIAARIFVTLSAARSGGQGDDEADLPMEQREGFVEPADVDRCVVLRGGRL